MKSWRDRFITHLYFLFYCGVLNNGLSFGRTPRAVASLCRFIWRSNGPDMEPWWTHRHRSWASQKLFKPTRVSWRCCPEAAVFYPSKPLWPSSRCLRQRLPDTEPCPPSTPNYLSTFSSLLFNALKRILFISLLERWLWTGYIYWSTVFRICALREICFPENISCTVLKL